MKFRSLLAIGIFLVSSVISHSEADETRNLIEDKIEPAVTEKAGIPPATYYPDQKESLRGLKGIGLLVEPLNPELEKTGIFRDQLKQGIELKLRQEGIRVLNQEERLKEPGKPYLYVNLNAYSWREEVIYGYSLKVDLNQLVLLDRDKNIGCFATTWYSGSAGIIGANKLKNFIRTELDTTIDNFVNDYLAANPR
jgi:hypothetical protein